MKLSRVRSCIYGQPWMITDRWLEAICEIFEKHINSSDRMEAEAASKKVFDDDPYRGELFRIVDGVAVLKVIGPIFPRANMMTDMSGATSVEQLRQYFGMALANDDAKSILLQIDSPGGSVSGVLETANMIFEARQRGIKPIISLAEGTCASAAYLIGSQADECFTTASSLVGSIGVVARLDVDERQLKNEGIDSEIFKTGNLKAIGNGAVTEEQRVELRRIVDTYFGQFKSAVARARPMLNMEVVSTGAVWVGQQAVDLGLVDGISTMEKLIADFGTKK